MTTGTGIAFASVIATLGVMLYLHLPWSAGVMVFIALCMIGAQRISSR